MQYILMAYVNETGWPTMTKAEQEQGVAAYMAYAEALTKAGVLTGSNRLQPSSAATTVRLADGKSQVLDGPYVGLEGAAGRLLRHRRARSGCRDLVGGPLPGRGSRRGRGASALGACRSRRMNSREGDDAGA